MRQRISTAGPKNHAVLSSLMHFQRGTDATIAHCFMQIVMAPPMVTITNQNPSERSKSIYLETFGCQMNELDTELVRGHLAALGYRFTSDFQAADVILYNTCSVREQAENKVWSRVGLMGLRKKQGANFVLGVIGCMAEREGPDMVRRFPQIDLMCGPGELDKLPMLIDNALKTEAVQLADRIALQGNTSRRASTLAATSDNLELLDLSRAFDPDRNSIGGGRSAYVRITRGCNKFCTYCVVPYTRGAEVHRPPDSIISECRKLADQGVIEVTLLGQTVNHYRYVHGTAVSVNGTELPQVGPGSGAFARKNPLPLRVESRARGETAGDIQSDQFSPQHSPFKGRGSKTTTFADLLKRIHDEVPAIQRLRFVTSFPRDFGDDILQVMADCPRICKYLHVPAQSGSNRILKLMNRGYTAEQYLDFIDRARAYLPDVCIAGDFIVGFPSETEEDFQQTKSLLRKARYKNSFIFKYSPRPGTVAIDRFADDVPDEIKRRRNNELLSLQSEISAEIHREFVGRRVNVFVEQFSRRPAPPQWRSGDTHASVHRVELRWERPPGAVETPRQAQSQNFSKNSSPTVQLSGRTEGDLIAVFDHPAGAAEGQPDHLLGQIVAIEVVDSGPLLLKGRLVDARESSASDPALPLAIRS
jgi:tRNA-2-methylthio-N6-dimethylallyladenosine synthase